MYLKSGSKYFNNTKKSYVQNFKNKIENIWKDDLWKKTKTFWFEEKNRNGSEHMKDK